MVVKEHMRISSNFCMVGNLKQISLPEVLPNEKKEKEIFIANEFAKIQKIKGSPLSAIKNSDDDSAGKPDIIANLNKNPVGIQLTELKIEHRPASYSLSNLLTEKLITEITKYAKPSFPILVTIYSSVDHENKSLKLNKRQILSLSRTISDAIINRDFSPSLKDIFSKNRPNNLKLKFLNIPTNLSNVIDKIYLSKIPDNYTVTVQGRDNIYIDFGFTAVVTLDSTIEKLLKDILKKRSLENHLSFWCGPVIRTFGETRKE